VSEHPERAAIVQARGRRLIGPVLLSLEWPGATIQHIMWADRQAEGKGGVVFSGSPSPWPGSRSNGENTARIVIMGTGTPGQPTRCVFNGASCTFRALKDSGSGSQHGYKDLVPVSA